MKTYSELARLITFEERFHYLKLQGTVGRETFGFDRYLNQSFYRSIEWKRVRLFVIARDLACDLGIDGLDIYDRVLVHHMNPIRVHDITESNVEIINPDYLITVSHDTHNAIHYGDEGLLRKPFVPRRPGDTRLW